MELDEERSRSNCECRLVMPIERLCRQRSLIVSTGLKAAMTYEAALEQALKLRLVLRLRNSKRA